MARRHPLPDWLAELAAELVKPPAFLQVLNPMQNPSDTVTAEARPHSAAPLTRSGRRGSGTRSGGSTSRMSRTSNAEANAVRTLPPRFAGSTDSAIDRDAEHHPASAKRQGGGSSGNGPARVQSAGEAVSDAERRWRAAFVHAEIPPDVARDYDWHIESARRVMNVVHVQTDRGAYAIKRTDIPPERVAFLYEAIEFARKRGFQRIARIVPTRRGRPYVERDGATYYATEWLTGQPLNFASSAQVGQLAHALAQFHEATRGFTRDSWTPPTAYDVAAMLERRSEDLRALIAVAQRRTHTDEFDRTLLRLAGDLRRDAERSVELASSKDCRAFLDRDRESAGLCHLDVIPSNFVYDVDKRVHLLDLDLAAHAPRVLDLGHLLRRALQLSNWHSEPAYACFLHYNAVRPLTPEEYVLTEALLTFPHRAWRLAAARYRGAPDDAQVAELAAYERQVERRRSFLTSFAKLVTRRR